MAGLASAAALRGLVSAEINRAPLCDVSNGDIPIGGQTRRRPHESIEHEDKPEVEVQRFTLVSRGAPPASRKRARFSNLLPPAALEAQLGDRIQVCRCSECPGSGRFRLCRRDTELHPEYALLLNMVSGFEAECPSRTGSRALVSDACCREKSAFFILNPERRAVGYVAAVVAANRRVVRQIAEETAPSIAQSPGPRTVRRDAEVEEPPHVLQMYVEPEYRRKGLASAALALLLRGHDAVTVDDPTWPVLKILEGLGFSPGDAQDGADGRPMIKFIRSDIVDQ